MLRKPTVWALYVQLSHFKSRSVNFNTNRTLLHATKPRCHDGYNGDSNTSNGNRLTIFALYLCERETRTAKKNDENSKDAKIGFLFVLRTRWFHWAKVETSIDEKSLKSLPCFNWYLHLRPSPAQTQRVFWVPCCVCDRGRLIKLNTIHTQEHEYRTRQ